MSLAARRVYGGDVSWSRSSWTAAVQTPAVALAELPVLDSTRRHAGRERSVDALLVVLAAALGALFLSPELHDNPDPWTTSQIVVDVVSGVLACAALGLRRRFPVEVALVCLLAGAVSSSATPAGLLALTSLAVHRPARPTVLVSLLWIPSLLAFAVYSPTTGPGSVMAFVMPLVLAASGWGMFIRARRQLLLSLRERALRAEADKELNEEKARLAERTRIAREMHDVLAHRISLMALHAGGLEVRPDLPPGEVRQTAALLRVTAGQALEELRGVIGVLRTDGAHEPEGVAPQPTLGDIRRLVEETRAAGMDVDLQMSVEHAEGVPAPLGRDAYRIVQEALTNIRKHAHGAASRVRVAGSPSQGLHISVRNPHSAGTHPGPSLPGAGAGLVGLRERVALAGGTLDLGPDGSGDFVVEANLTWHA
jgi:signal transduction histidine kinase